MINSVVSNEMNFTKKTLVFSVLITILFHSVVLISKLKQKIEMFEDSNEEEKIVIKLNTNSQMAKQIVQAKKSEMERKTEDSKFLSDSNNFVDRQTVAKDIGQFQDAAQGVRNGEETQLEMVQKNKKEIKFSDLGLERQKLTEKLMNPTPVQKARKGLENGRGEKVGLSKRSDYIEEMPLGDFTKLNTVEYKYYGFFFRIKQKLEQFWGDSIQTVAKNMYKEGRRLPANKHYITSLVISMDPTGKIVKVDVDSTSGVRELDGAAITSFNQAGPFPNPPKGLIVNGIATIRWKFAVDAGN